MYIGDYLDFALPVNQESIQVDQNHQESRDDQEGKDDDTDGYSVYQDISPYVSIRFLQKIHRPS
jgi:hypothetical protein